MTVHDTPEMPRDCRIPGIGRPRHRHAHQAASRRNYPGASNTTAASTEGDWPAWEILATQIRDLFGSSFFWEGGGPVSTWIDPFFLVATEFDLQTPLTIFFTTGDAWTDIGFTFRSNDPGLSDRHKPPVRYSAFSFWWSTQLCGNRAALYHLLRIDPENFRNWPH